MGHSTRPVLYPLKFTLLPMEKVWGGQKLKGLLGGVSAGIGNIGEVWEVWEGLAVANGPLRGQTLKTLVHESPRGILGDSIPNDPEIIFPLLLKLIDAQDTLSVQVHPDDGYARAREKQPFGKTEMWYVLEAEPDARIVHGLNRPVDQAELRHALERGTLTELLEFVPVARGDIILLTAGTIHALGKGIMVYELQQSSDLTYRLYDWGRRPSGGVTRELHVDKSLEVARLEPIPNHKIRAVDLPETDHRRRLLCACSYFAVEQLVSGSPITQQLGGRFHIITALEGTVSLHPTGSQSEELTLHPLESALVPAELSQYQILPLEKRYTVMKAYIPDLRADIVSPLLAAGVPKSEVVQLGVDPTSISIDR